ncbi:MAG: tRNA (cytidine(34)-2'-O)-methyltransferase [Lachnospiraceae bacterium]|nr:tRNA (cytidine(34)-2'-O)-methyltransferase [Lachnospiraceae bacterium]
MNIVLHQPEIPSNTGNIGRTCVATGSALHLIEPLGFRLTGKELRRAGMDYWEHLDVRRYMNYEEFAEKNLTGDSDAKIWFATTKAKRLYTEASFGKNDFIMFGKESAGIPEELLVDHEEACIRIPMLDSIRSLNLSNSVSVILYEALRQQGFAGMQLEGALHHMNWKADALE